MANATTPPPRPTETLTWSDGQLLAAVAQSGVPACFEILVRRHTSMVYGVCRRLLGNDSDAEDAAQTVFLVLWKKAGRLTREGSVAAWLHRVSRNVCRNELRTRHARERREREAKMQRPAFSDVAAAAGLREFLDEELDRLPEKYRTLLILFHLEGRSLEEISSLTRTKATTIGTQLVRARNLLAERLTRRGAVATGMTLGTLLAAQSVSASPPANFVAATTQAAQAFALAKPAAGAVVSKSATAADALLRSMALAQFKIVAGVTTLLIAVTGGLLLIPASQKIPRSRETAALSTAGVPALQFDDGLYEGRIETIASDSMVQFSAAFSADGRRLAVAQALTGGAGDLRIWEIPSGRMLHQRFEPSGITSLAISPKGDLMAYGCGDHEIRILATDAFESLRTLTGQVLGPSGLAFSPNGRWLASSGWDWTVRVWDVASGELMAVEKAAGQYISTVQFDSSGRRLLSGPAAEVLESWDWDGGVLRRSGQRPVPASNPAAAVLSPTEERVVLIARDGLKVIVAGSEDGKVLRELTVPSADGRVTALASSDDTSNVFATTDRGVILGWSRDSEAPAARWDAHDGRATALATDSVGRHVASIGFDGAIRVWNADERSEVCRLVEPKTRDRGGRPGLCVAGPGGRFHLIERGAGEFMLYDTRSGRLIAQLPLPPEEARVAAVSSDGTRLLSAGESGRVQVTDMAQSGSAAMHAIHFHPVTLLAWLPDDRRCLSGDSSGVVCVSEPNSGRVLFRKKLHDGPVRCCSVMRDGRRLITAGDDGVLRLLDPVELRESQELGRHAAGIVAVAVGPSNTLMASADAEGGISLWHLNSAEESMPGRLERHLTPDEWRPEPASDAERSSIPAALAAVQRVLPTDRPSSGFAITALAISPQEQTLLIGTDAAMLAHLDLTTSRVPRQTPTMAPVSSLTFPEDDTALIVGLADGQLYRQRASLVPERTLTGHSKGVRFVTYTDGGRRLFSGGEDTTIRLWDVNTGQQLASVESGHGAVVRGAVSPDGRTLVTAGYGKGVYFWDAGSLKRTTARYDHGERVSALMFSPEGRWIASGSWDTTVRLWDPATQTTVRTFKGLTKGVADVRFSPDGKLLAACSGNWTEWFRNGEVCVWEIDSGRLKFHHQGTNGAYGSLQFSPEGDRLCATGTEIVQIWDVASGMLLEARAGGGGTSECDFLDQQTLVLRGHPHGLQVWDLPTGLIRSSFSVNTQLLFDLETSPDGRRFATATADGRIVIWPFPMTGSHD